MITWNQNLFFLCRMYEKGCSLKLIWLLLIIVAEFFQLARTENVSDRKQSSLQRDELKQNKKVKTFELVVTFRK